MAVSAEDRVSITELIRMHGHLIDNGRLDLLHEVFTEDVAYDVTALGLGVLQGLAAIQEAALALGAGNPVGHHVTNIVLTSQGSDEVFAVSKGLGVNADGTCASVTYEDTVRRGPDGWRITRRKVLPRRVPLGG
ncbi:nuclear transport factor 2 family protein [Thermomonospora amylolytica]|uniref:nuclear transport factor 2 family protein n=1 Tax=Thermomonospora amylolytica TaxID=1411117 RepID=UPI000E6D590D|nr:nuclear transport factor 2 family protein [Thermomonospora amylolytica]